MFQYKHQIKPATTLKQAILQGLWFGLGAACFVACIVLFAVAVTGGFK